MITCLCTAVLLSVPQAPPPVLGVQQRFVDFSRDLERPGVAVLVGTLGKLKEGRRERLEEAVLGGRGAQVSVSGTQYFKVQARADLAVKAVLHGKKPGRTTLEFELQLARLPDGNERRQMLGGSGTPIETDRLALWVVETPEKGRSLVLLHSVVTDPRADRTPEAFEDLCRDFTAINAHVAALRAALAALEAAGDAASEPGSLPKARAGLQNVLDARPELREPKHDALLQQHAGPLEQRARKALGDAKG